MCTTSNRSFRIVGGAAPPGVEGRWRVGARPDGSDGTHPRQAPCDEGSRQLKSLSPPITKEEFNLTRRPAVIMDELGEARERVGRYIDDSRDEMIAFLSEYIRHRS